MSDSYAPGQQIKEEERKKASERAKKSYEEDENAGSKEEVSEEEKVEINISKILQKYDVYGKDGEGIAKNNWNISNKNKVTGSVNELDMDYYWNFKGVTNPRIEVEFFVKDTISREGKWININEIKGMEGTSNNNYFVSANITDNGIKRLNLVLYDRNFTDIQRLLGNAIQFANERMSNNDDKNSVKEKKHNMSIEGGEDIKMFVNKSVNFTNLRIRYGYNEDLSTRVNPGYIGVVGWGDGATDKSRWRNLISESSVSSDPKSKNADNRFLSTEETLTRDFQQSTILSPYEEFFITGLNTTLTNSGIKYNIQAVSIDDFALNGYKMYQQYSKITGKPKTVIATLMKKFNEEDSNDTSPIKLVWADEEVRADESTINGSEILYDYENGTYIEVDEKNAETIKEINDEPIKDLTEYIEMLNNIKSCFTNKANCTISSYVYNLDILREENISEIERKITGRKPLDEIGEKPKKKSFMDAVLYPFEKPEGFNDYHGTNIIEMAMYANEVAKNYDFLKEKNLVEEAGENVKVTASELIKSWLGMIAINAYGINLNSSSNIKLQNLIEKDKKLDETQKEFEDTCSKMKDVISVSNNKLPIQLDINVPYGLVNIYKTPNYYFKSTKKFKYENSSYIESNFGNSYLMGKFCDYNLNNVKNFFEADNEKNEKELSNFINIISFHHMTEMDIFKPKTISGLFDKKIDIEKMKDFSINSMSGYLEKIPIPEGYIIEHKGNTINMSELSRLNSFLSVFLNPGQEWYRSSSKYNNKIEYITVSKDFYDMDLSKKIEIVHNYQSGPMIYRVQAQIDGKDIIEPINIKYLYDIEKYLPKFLKNIVSVYRSLKEKSSTFKFYNNEGEVADTIKISNSGSWGFLENYYTNLKNEESVENNQNIKEARENYLRYLSFINNFINSKYNDYKVEEISKKYNDAIEDYNQEYSTMKSEGGDYNSILNNILSDIESSDKNINYREFKIDKNGSTEKFGAYDKDNDYVFKSNRNILDAAFNIASKKSEILEKNVENLIKDIDTKINYLNEKKDILIKEQEKIDNSNIGKEIELSLGSQESRNQKLNLTKTIASLLNDLCSQCAPKITAREINKKDGKETIYDEAGNSKIVNIYDNMPRYNLTWGIVGYYKKTVPIVGLYYKRPKKVQNLRRYNWGTGNNKPHCIKALNISASSEYALMNINTLTKGPSGNNVTVKDNDVVKSIDNITIPKTCFFSQVFESTRDENIFNNYNNSLNKGTLTLLGDPSLKFYGSIQPFTYPIHLNIKLTRERVKDWSEKEEVTIPDSSIAPVSQLSGYYMITSIVHDISNSGYTTTLEIMRYPGSDELYR